MTPELDAATNRLIATLDVIAGRAVPNFSDDPEEAIKHWLHILSLQRSGLRTSVSEAYSKIALRNPFSRERATQ